VKAGGIRNHEFRRAPKKANQQSSRAKTDRKFSPGAANEAKAILTGCFPIFLIGRKVQTIIKSRMKSWIPINSWKFQRFFLEKT